MNKMLNKFKQESKTTKLLIVFDALLIAFILLYNIVLDPWSVVNVYHSVEAKVAPYDVRVTVLDPRCEEFANSEEFAQALNCYTDEQLQGLNIYFVDDLHDYIFRLGPGVAAFTRRNDIFLSYDGLKGYEHLWTAVVHHEIAHFLFANLDSDARHEIKDVFKQGNRMALSGLENGYMTTYAQTSIDEDIADTWGFAKACENILSIDINWTSILEMKYEVLNKYFQ